MSPTGFRWFVCAVVAALVVIMLVVVRGNGWAIHGPTTSAGELHSMSTPARPAIALAAGSPAGALRDRAG